MTGPLGFDADVSDAPAILFTSFEPSGDDHASAVIAELVRRHPHVRIFAWGGPKMEAAGAEIVEHTGRDAVMGVPGIGKILEHRSINKRIAAWLEHNPIRVHVPVDSPAANFPICKLAKQAGARVVHLVAPQVWAWAGWRVHKLKRLTNFVCCVLPFEEQWFRERGVRARFVGHPLFDHPINPDELDRIIDRWPTGRPRLALLPGSRPAEIRKNFPLLIAAYRQIAAEHPEMAGVAAVTRPEVEPVLRELAAAGGVWPPSLRVVSGQTDAAIRWADLCLVVSGTVTLQIARQCKPMVIVYKSSWLAFNLIGRWLVTPPHFSLPNLIAGQEIVPELIPHFGGSDAIVHEAVGLLERPELVEQQKSALAAIASRFEGFHAAVNTADVIERAAGLVPASDLTPKPTSAP
ncbi:MAG: lipid-A-disaccharide synthase [Phycisphaerales bacterium]